MQLNRMFGFGFVCFISELKDGMFLFTDGICWPLTSLASTGLLLLSSETLLSSLKSSIFFLEKYYYISISKEQQPLINFLDNKLLAVAKKFLIVCLKNAWLLKRASWNNPTDLAISIIQNFFPLASLQAAPNLNQS